MERVLEPWREAGRVEVNGEMGPWALGSIVFAPFKGETTIQF